MWCVARVTCLLIIITSRRVPGEGKSSVCLICMKYRIIILIIIIISLGEILFSYIANTSRTHALTRARTHARKHMHARPRASERAHTTHTQSSPFRFDASVAPKHDEVNALTHGR